MDIEDEYATFVSQYSKIPPNNRFLIVYSDLSETDQKSHCSDAVWNTLYKGETQCKFLNENFGKENILSWREYPNTDQLKFLNSALENINSPFFGTKHNNKVKLFMQTQHKLLSAETESSDPS